MSIQKNLIGLEEKHIELLDRMVNKKDKRFKNKSAVVRTLLDCFCQDKADGKLDGVIVLRKGNCSAFEFNSENTGDLIDNATTINIDVVKNTNAPKRPSVNIQITETTSI